MPSTSAATTGVESSMSNPNDRKPDVQPAPSFADTYFPHPVQRRAIDVVVNAVVRPGGQQFVAVSGPPGTGKSLTFRMAHREFLRRWHDAMVADPDIRPVVAVEAPSPIGSEFPWGELFKELLGALGDEGVDRLIGELASRGTRPDRMIRPGRLSANELLRIAVRRYRARKVKVLLIDEAQHMGVAPGTAVLKRNLDILKGFANKTGVRIVLFGTYELLAFHRASAQLARRMLDVHMQRYHWAVAAERDAFESVARQMLVAIGGLSEEEVELSIPDCYERSLGCIGELHDWLVQAAFEFEATGRRRWAASLAATAPSTPKAIEILDQIEHAEEAVRESASARRRLRERLGLDDVRARGSRVSTPAQAAGAPPKPRPGRRRPVRDAVEVHRG